MSLILEALNKADREREEQTPVPHLQTIHGRMAPQPPIKKHFGLYIVVAMLVLILFLLIVLLVRQAHVVAPVKTPSTLVAVVPAKTFATVPPPNSLAEPQAMASDLAANAGDVQAIYQDAQNQPPAARRDVENLYEDAPPPPKMNARSKHHLLEDLEAEASSQDAEQPAADEQPVKPRPAKSIETAKPAVDGPDLDAETVQRLWEETKQAVPDAPADPNKIKTQINNAVQDNLALYKEVPFLHDLPQTFQNTVPTLNYNNHIYSDKGGAVVFNKKTYKVGEEVVPGLLIERIASDGVLLLYKGKRFKLTALNSWVNI